MTKPSTPNHVRDIIIGILALAIVATNYYWYEMSTGVDLSLRNGAQAWVVSEGQIGKLKSCIDNNTKPCNIEVPSSSQK